LHTCWIIYFCLLNSNLCLNFVCFLFFKNGKIFIFLHSFSRSPAQPSSQSPVAPPQLRRPAAIAPTARSPSCLFGLVRPSSHPRRLPLLMGGSRQSSPTLGQRPAGVGTPTLSRLCARPGRGPARLGAPPGATKRVVVLRAASPLQLQTLESSIAPSRSCATLASPSP
jgi:hypothetical protein